MIKHDTFNDKFSSRLTQNGSIIIMISNWSLAIQIYVFFPFQSKLVLVIFSNSKTANSKHLQNRL